MALGPGGRRCEAAVPFSIMPKELHDKLKRQASKLKLAGDRRNAYIYGTMQRIEKGGKLSDLLKNRKRKPN